MTDYFYVAENGDIYVRSDGTDGHLLTTYDHKYNPAYNCPYTGYTISPGGGTLDRDDCPACLPNTHTAVADETVSKIETGSISTIEIVLCSGLFCCFLLLVITLISFNKFKKHVSNLLCNNYHNQN